MSFPGPVSTKDWLTKFDRPYLTIDCGDWSYGKPIIQSADADVPRKLVIGRYCSIGENVKIYVGRQGRHAINTLTTYPLLMAVNPDKRQPLTQRLPWMDQQLDVVIGHDVWICSDVTIMAGVTIGTGAVIGTGAIVTKDVPPYGIAVGVPANVKKFRHEGVVAQKLLASRWWELDPDTMWELLGEKLFSTDMSAVIELIVSGVGAKPPEPGPLAGKSLEELIALFTGPKQADIPCWPSESEQMRFTGGFGVPLLKRAVTLVEEMEKDGAFANPRWRGLDYGCGWGRIASYLLTLGAAEQLDMCDAWQDSVDMARNAGFKNKIFKVSDVLKAGELTTNAYDFCFAMSIFTHLDRSAFENNLRVLVAALKPGGRLYFTVRHQSFLDNMIANGKATPRSALDSSGFWHLTYPDRECYGETAVSREYVEAVGGALGSIDYLGLPEFEQHLYRIMKA